MRKHHNKLFYGKYRYKVSFDFKWAPMLYPTTDEHLQSFIDGKQTQTKYLNTKFWKVSSDVIALAKFIKDNRTRMKFRLQQNKAMFYTDKKLANELVISFWQDWIESKVVDPKYARLEENTVGCTKLPHGKYRYQIHLKKQKAWNVNEEKRQALIKFLDTNVDNTFVTNGLLLDWLEGKDTWYPASYFYVTEEKYLSPLYVIAGEIIDKVIKFKELKNASNKKTTRS
tara:strand:+ start:2015 stop:2695 length:681 start_codon:yes stop_codon:yes gene_type:complete